jgi:nitrous oxide reductase accessory protein NosL
MGFGGAKAEFEDALIALIARWNEGPARMPANLPIPLETTLDGADFATRIGGRTMRFADVSLCTKHSRCPQLPVIGRRSG